MTPFNISFLRCLPLNNDDFHESYRRWLLLASSLPSEGERCRGDEATPICHERGGPTSLMLFVVALPMQQALGTVRPKMTRQAVAVLKRPH